nr:hypothetical protein [uncultured Porphyromonas sp.]
MNEQEIRKLIPELVWEKVDIQLVRYEHEVYQALDYRLGPEEMYYRIAQHPLNGMYYTSMVSKCDTYKGYQSWNVMTSHSLEGAKRLAQEHRAKVICQMLNATPSSDHQEKLAEASQTINVRELLEQELDHLSDEANRGEWDTLPNEMKYLKRKQYDTLLSYLTLLDQLEECEDKNAELKRRNEL